MSGEQRRLAAILVADVVGYSKLVGSDEAKTLADLQTLRSLVIEPAIAKHAGRLFKSIGDGFLVEFASAVQAVTCAVEIQNAGPSLPLRIGIHVGDVVVQGDDLMGDGVNVAARIEGTAQPGGIAISRQVHDQVRDKLRLGFEDKGEVSLKNLVRPVHVFSLSGARPPALAPALFLPDKPSIAVLPFQNTTGNREHDPLAHAITDGLITDLSRQGRLSVVGGPQSAKANETSGDTVLYLVEGSVQPSAQRVRINVQLIRAADGNHLWADRFDKPAGDTLDLQDEIVERISRALAVQVREAEIARAATNREAQPDTETLILLGRRTFTNGACRTNSQQAAALYGQALALDDGNAFAHCMLSITRTVLHVMNWSETPDHERSEAIRHRDRAHQLEPALPWCLVASAWILWSERKFQAAVAAFERIAQMSPSAGGNAFTNLALAKSFVGRSVEAETELMRAIQVFPGEPQIDIWHYYLGITRIFLAKYGDAANALRIAVSLNPQLDTAYILLAALNVSDGNLESACAAIRDAQLLGTRWTVAAVRTSIFSGVGIGLDDGRMTALWDGLRLAGLPE